MTQASRLLWCTLTVIATIAATVVVWHLEADSAGSRLQDTYYLSVLSFIPVTFVAWLAASAVLLAHRVGYRGRWYFLSQGLALLLMVVKAIAWSTVEPTPFAASEVSLALTPVRIILLALTAAVSVAWLLSVLLCFDASLRIHAPADGIRA